MIAVVDSGVANVASVMAALYRLKVTAEVTADATKLRTASHVILPGVGAADAAMAQLKEKKLIDVLRDLTQPVLGICLGMQLMFTASEEGAKAGCMTPCLGLLAGTVQRLPASQDRPVPHMGWNQVVLSDRSHPLLRGVTNSDYVYFVHSFAVPVGTQTLASCDYGFPFTAVAGFRNFLGCQFHPERSGAVGARILKNFMDI